ncbi:MAG: hypothetical protein ACJ74D_08360 [Gaiellaceae bacterium]
MHIHSLKRAALAACAVAVLAGSPAVAEAVTTKLRVEAGGHDIGPGFRYVHGSVSYDTSTACGGTGDGYTINGPSALGLLFQAADFTRGLRPVQVSDQFEFGQFVCGVGGYEGSDTAFWLYKVDHVAPEVGGDQFPINRLHREVLWYFVNGASNSGDELGLTLSDNVVQAGDPVDVTVRQYDANGTASPAAGVTLQGAGDVMTDANGHATVVFDEAGRPFIRGVRDPDIETDRLHLCVWESSASECDRWLTGWTVGTDGDDRMRGTDDPERLAGRRGDDRINSRGDDASDSVRCGRGDDVARVDMLDRVKRNCETVRRR